MAKERTAKSFLVIGLSASTCVLTMVPFSTHSVFNFIYGFYLCFLHESENFNLTLFLAVCIRSVFAVRFNWIVASKAGYQVPSKFQRLIYGRAVLIVLLNCLPRSFFVVFGGGWVNTSNMWFENTYVVTDYMMERSYCARAANSNKNRIVNSTNTINGHCGV